MRENDLLDGKLLELVEGDKYFIDEVFTYFVNTNCDNKAMDLVYDTDYELSVDQDITTLLGYFYRSADRYEKDSSVYNKILYAYNIFVLAFFLAEQEKMSDNEYSILSNVCQTIEELLRYCFYPEIFAMFDMFFGRLYPNNILWRIAAGIDSLKRLGYKAVYQSYQEAYDYFNNQ